MEQIGMRDMILRCVDCGSNYVLGIGKIRFCGERGLHLRRRRVECRRKRRQKQEAQNNHQGGVNDG